MRLESSLRKEVDYQSKNQGLCSSRMGISPTTLSDLNCSDMTISMIFREFLKYHDALIIYHNIPFYPHSIVWQGWSNIPPLGYLSLFCFLGLIRSHKKYPILLTYSHDKNIISQVSLVRMIFFFNFFLVRFHPMEKFQKKPELFIG